MLLILSLPMTNHSTSKIKGYVDASYFFTIIIGDSSIPR
jgi:hypothetical protein